MVGYVVYLMQKDIFNAIYDDWVDIYEVIDGRMALERIPSDGKG